MSVLEKLKQRGFIHQEAGDLQALFDREGPVKFYLGIDPTAESLHVGHLVPIVLARHLIAAGHIPIFLFGGATGSIGDPSCKAKERHVVWPDLVARNLKKLQFQLQSLLGVTSHAIVNNKTWIDGTKTTEWLFDVGRHISVNQMLAKDSVEKRRENGLTFLEFSYMVFQAWDFKHLVEQHQCDLQIGGADQWGNITLGIEVVRKAWKKTVYGLTCPLVTTATGEKLGKTTGNAVWLDPEMTSPWDFYQYFMRIQDADVMTLTKLLTMLTDDRLAELEQATAETPGQRAAQKALAFEMTKWTHGESEAEHIRWAAERVYKGDLTAVAKKDPLLIRALSLPEIDVPFGTSLVELLEKVLGSKGKGRRLIQSGGAYINDERIEDEDFILKHDQLITKNRLLLRTGKKNYYLVQLKE